jgi:hypothetical protein
MDVAQQGDFRAQAAYDGACVEHAEVRWTQGAILGQADLSRQQPAMEPERRAGYLRLNLLPSRFGTRKE